MSPFQEILKALRSPRALRLAEDALRPAADPTADSRTGLNRRDVAVGAYALRRPSDFGKQIRVPAEIANDNGKPAVGL